MLSKILIEIFGNIYKLFKKSQKLFFKNLFLNLSGIFFIIFIPLLYYIYIFNPYKVNNYLPKTIIFVSIFIIFYLLSFSVIGFESNKFSNYAFSRSGEFFLIIFIFLGCFLLFSIFYNISKKIMLNNNFYSFLITLTLVIFSLSIIYNTFISKLNLTKDNYTIMKFLIDIIFYIPCLITDTIDYIKKDIKNSPTSTYVLSSILIIYILIVYLIPIIINYIKDTNEISLLKSKEPLNKKIIYINQDELKKKIINNKPYLQRKIIENKEYLEKSEKYYQDLNNSSIASKYNKYNHRKVFYNDPQKSILIKNIPECKEKNIICEDDYLYCKDDDTSYKIKNYHGMYEYCEDKPKSFFNLFSLFKNNSDLTFIYKDKKRENKISLSNYCKDTYNTNSISCINKNDISYVDFINNNNIDTDLSYVYSCNNTYINLDETNPEKKKEKYNLIFGYNDISDNLKDFSCRKEGFRPNYHNLDVNAMKSSYLNTLTDGEKKILYDTIEQDPQAASLFNKIRSDDDMEIFIKDYLNQNKIYQTIMSKIYDYNNKKNEFILQEMSNLIRYINRANKIHDYNYHYAISFWIFLDSTILKNDNTTSKGFIMNYANNPMIYYDYERREIIISVNNCKNNDDDQIECNEKIIYRTNEILYQTWNNFIINYNYGTLDIFINSNLVSTEKNISPYITENKNILQFGDNREPLINSGICNINYYEKPLNLNQIKNIYKNKNNPCH